MLIPAFAKSLVQALAGAMAKSIGSTAASSQARIRAMGLSPRSLAAYSLIKIIAAAPSLILEALAAVIVPFF
jgi:hypothetical protein